MLWPNAGGSRALREFNHNHDKLGRFASGAALVGPETAMAIVKSSPEFDVEAAAKAMGPAFESQLNKMLADAPAAHAAMEKGLQNVVAKVGGQMEGNYRMVLEGTGIRAVMGPDKSARRIIEKALLETGGDLSQISDVVRSTVVVDKLEDVKRVRDAIGQEFQVLREKDRFTNPSYGYRDYMLKVAGANGVNEIQIHVRPLLKVKETQGHTLYEQFRRAAGNAAQIAAIGAKMTALYSTAWATMLAASGHRGF